MDTPITRAEHDEFRRRMEDEHKRINHRLSDTEESIRRIGELTASVEKLAQSVENMAKARENTKNVLKNLRGVTERHGGRSAAMS